MSKPIEDPDEEILKEVEKILRSDLNDHDKVIAIQIVSCGLGGLEQIMEIVCEFEGVERTSKLHDLLDEVRKTSSHLQ